MDKNHKVRVKKMMEGELKKKRQKSKGEANGCQRTESIKKPEES